MHLEIFLNKILLPKKKNTQPNLENGQLASPPPPPPQSPNNGVDKGGTLFICFM
jgi:hypothetical protein